MAAFLGALAAAAAGCGGSDGDASARAGRASNLVLITIDTLRADRLGCTGHGAAATPVLDALARDGVLLDHVIAPVPITLPSHAALMTGRLPHELGVRDNTPYAVPGSAETLAEVLSASGYQTVAVVSGEPLAPGCGLEQGFDRYLFRPESRRDGVLLEESPADRTVDLVLASAENLDAARPVFLWVHFFDPHVPYEPHGSGRGSAAPGGAAPEPAGGSDAGAYDAEIAFVDREIGRLLEGLSARGLMATAVLAITSDHGEGLGDHGEATHAYFLFDSTLRVPLIVRGPGIPGGRRTAAQARLRDLPGAILAVLGDNGAGGRIDSDHAMVDPASRDLAAFWTAEATQPSPGRPAFAESLFCHDHFGWAQMTAMRTDHFKVIRGARTEVYDLQADPHENSPLDPVRAGGEGLRLAKLLGERTASAQTPDAPETLLPGSLPGYFGGTTGGERRFATAERNASLPHPPDCAGRLARFLHAVELNQSGMLNRALDLLRELAAEDPRNPSVLFWQGRTARSLAEKEGDSALLENALALFREARRVDPGFNDADHMAVWCLLQLGRFEEAEAELGRRLTGHPEDAAALELCGFLYTTPESNSRRNPCLDVEKGVRCFEQSLVKNQNNARLLQKLAELYKTLGRTDLEETTRRRLDRLEAWH